MTIRALSLLALCLTTFHGPAQASAAAAPSAPLIGDIDVGSDGSDGAFNPVANTVIDLATQGTYDPVNWRVVFNYTSVDIPAGVTVSFANHPSRAPVVWLSQTDITIGGTVSLDGGAASAGWVGDLFYAEPGPGGFRGGLAEPASPNWLSSSGLGPGGGYQHQSTQQRYGGGAGHMGPGVQGPQVPGLTNSWGGSGGATYGSEKLLQLIGGSGGGAGRAASGGGGNVAASGGGAGGGALLLAANNEIVVTATGRIRANGGQANAYAYRGGAGSGGAIRLVADSVALDLGAQIQALPGAANGGGAGSVGRIRLEANTFDVNAVTQPAHVPDLPGPTAAGPNDATAVILSINGQAVPADPRASLGQGQAQADVPLTHGLGSVIVIETTHVPLDSAVYLRIARGQGGAGELLVTDGVTSPLTEVSPGAPDLRARTSITHPLNEGFSALQARVVFPTP